MAKSNPGRERARTKEERRARSLANLEKHKIKKGEVRNPAGKNGRARSDYVVSVIEELDQAGVSHIRRILLKQIERAKRGSDQAGKTLIDHYKGKARLEVDLKSTDGSMSPTRRATTAETRQELDRVLEVIEKRAGAAKAPEQAPPPGGRDTADEEQPKASP